jgi:hypothetical protein
MSPNSEELRVNLQFLIIKNGVIVVIIISYVTLSNENGFTHL